MNTKQSRTVSKAQKLGVALGACILFSALACTRQVGDVVNAPEAIAGENAAPLPMEDAPSTITATSPEPLAFQSQTTWTGAYKGIVGQKIWNNMAIPSDERGKITLPQATGKHSKLVFGWVTDPKSSATLYFTGAIVGPRHVLTAAHNVYNTAYTSLSEPKGYPYTGASVQRMKDLKTFSISKVIVPDTWKALSAGAVAEDFGGQDYALLVTSTNIASVTGTPQNGDFFNVTYYADPATALKDVAIYLYGVPNSQLACAAAPVKDPAMYSGAFGKCGAGNLYGMAVINGFFGFSDPRVLQHKMDVQEGQSGAPLYVRHDNVDKYHSVIAIQSFNSTGQGGFAHRINATSRQWIKDRIAENP